MTAAEVRNLGFSFMTKRINRFLEEFWTANRSSTLRPVDVIFVAPFGDEDDDDDDDDDIPPPDGDTALGSSSSAIFKGTDSILSKSPPPLLDL
mmetsp:Transcript_12364/g.19511  ORF Transcript_12364/g.19511 Transcript_12364/m.19511 type:complete len:93 (+) Transcript_12364:416-694(+)